jgi:branched-subunit amino acid transport protein
MIDRVIDIIFELKMNLARSNNNKINFNQYTIFGVILLSDTVWHSKNS